MFRNSLILALLLSVSVITAQNNAGIGTANPNPYAILDIESSDKGLLIPRLSSLQKDNLGQSLSTGEEGLLVYDTDLQSFYYWDGLVWVEMGSAGGDDDWIGAGTGQMYAADLFDQLGIGLDSSQAKLPKVAEYLPLERTLLP